MRLGLVDLSVSTSLAHPSLCSETGQEYVFLYLEPSLQLTQPSSPSSSSPFESSQGSSRFRHARSAASGGHLNDYFSLPYFIFEHAGRPGPDQAVRVRWNDGRESQDLWVPRKWLSCKALRDYETFLVYKNEILLAQSGNEGHHRQNSSLLSTFVGENGEFSLLEDEARSN